MKERSFNVLGDQEQEYINFLSDLGLKNIEAKVLVAIACSPGMNQTEIEHMTGTKCSAISIATNNLVDRGILRCSLMPSAENRMRKAFYLNGCMNDIVDILVSERKKQTAGTLSLFKNARVIAKKVIG